MRIILYDNKNTQLKRTFQCRQQIVAGRSNRVQLFGN